MIERTLTGLLGVLLILGMTVAGCYALVANFVLESRGDLLVPTLASAAVAFAVVFVLFAVGARSDRWLQSPYW